MQALKSWGGATETILSVPRVAGREYCRCPVVVVGECWGGLILFIASSLQTAESHQRQDTCGLKLAKGLHSPCGFSSQRRWRPFLLLSSFSDLNCVLYKMFYISSYVSVIWDKNNEPKMNQPTQRTKMISFSHTVKPDWMRGRCGQIFLKLSLEKHL